MEAAPGSRNSAGDGNNGDGNGNGNSPDISKSKPNPNPKTNFPIKPVPPPGPDGLGGPGGPDGPRKGGFDALPVWAWVLIILLIIWFILFVAALTYYLIRERKRKRQGHKFRFGHVLTRSLLASTGLCLPVFLYRKFAARRNPEPASGHSGAPKSVYAHVEEGHADGTEYYKENHARNNTAQRSRGSPPPYAPSDALHSTTDLAATRTATVHTNAAPTQHPPVYSG